MSTPAPAPTWPQLDERDHHYLGLAGANIVATQALLSLHENLADVVEQPAMMCVHGNAGLGMTLSVNAALRALAPAAVCRVQFRARPAPRDIRHVLFEGSAGRWCGCYWIRVTRYPAGVLVVVHPTAFNSRQPSGIEVDFSLSPARSYFSSR